MRIETIIAIPKSFYVSWRLVGFKKALKLPVRVRHNTRLISLSGHVTINDDHLSIHQPRMLVGLNSISIFDKRTSPAILDINGEITLEGTASFGQGAKISVGRNGVLTLGDGFTNTAELTLVCHDRITCGRNVLVGWDTTIMDNDFHNTSTLLGEINECHSPVNIGNDVWIGTKAVLLKGSIIPSGCIVGASALVCRSFYEENTMIAGNPAKVRKRDVRWIK